MRLRPSKPIRDSAMGYGFQGQGHRRICRSAVGRWGDACLNHRLIKLTERFADKPTASIPGACPDWSETQGVYRFFDQANNAKRPLKWETVLAPHIERTAARMRQHRVVLCLQD
ncbi:IS4/Tn5 family transposase DNA-binding protein, partial [Verminephrobacter eiseniae]|uniref:IS4/Tn5 family transposase DNA-binding protein n=2 Tax=Verminephrobacter eiseniae TaxID=364317 RepID=UPI002ADD36EC